MNEEMQQDAVDVATQAMEKYNIEKDIAAFIKREFDKKYNPTWHCIVGRNFGSYVTHETKVSYCCVFLHDCLLNRSALHLLLSRTSGYFALQVWLRAGVVDNNWRHQNEHFPWAVIHYDMKNFCNHQ
jgi:hypothetical protein